MIQVGIVGATGYAGAELCRLIMGHSKAEIAAISSVSFEGMKLSDVYPSYFQICDLVCETEQEVLKKSDVIFAALPHGLSQDLAKACDEAGKIFIDLGADFRLKDEEIYKTWYDGVFDDKELHQKAVYGLPEFNREKIKNQKLIANPGCYTTAVPLALAPALRAGVIDTKGMIADCKSGVTGAGRKPNQANHYPELNENFYAYKVASHRHTPEIEQTLSQLSGEEVHITFVPHLLPVNRGILATCYARLKKVITQQEIDEIYQSAYGQEAFIRLLPPERVPNIRHVWYTNYCDIAVRVDSRTGTLVAISAIDNMVKGAAGQAIQNMNLCLGLGETEGLLLVPPAF